MMKVEIAPVPNHSLNQSITHYIFMIDAFKKKLKQKTTDSWKTHERKLFFFGHH
jgi:hypothetical protein